ncbi:hypothetical protein MXL84_06695 [Enterococcus gallinarum]|uniref:hypothetical protein n=1 Tax=Enterococcus gallinarum TaxID=1353 RepID=UPI00115A14A1|nr:hypothetical protein [Enterococcus gallinarum]MEB5881600.1 hypothetical protein [Enterococcus gallinarum]
MLTRSKAKIFYPYGLIVLLSIFLLTPQLFQRSLIFSADWLFHMNRFYETAMQIEHGTFNYFQSIYSFNQSGRVINAMYGADFAYFSGLILLLTKNWYRFELVMNFLCLFFAGLNMYKLSQYTGLKTKIALICAIFYMGSPSVIYWITHQGFSGIGYCLLPLALIPAVRMVKNRANPINPIFLGLIMALLISVHLFTAALATILLVPFFMYCFYYSDNKKRIIIQAFSAVLIAIGLSANTFFAYIDLMGNNLAYPFIPKELYSTTAYLSTNSMNFRNFGLILSTLFIFQIVYMFSYWNNLSIIERLLNVIGSMFLLFSSSYFPWNHLTELFPSLLKIQFLRRFMGIPSLLLILAFGLSLKRILIEVKSKSAKKNILILLITFALLNLTNGSKMIDNQAKLWNSNDPLSADTNVAEQLVQDPHQIRKLLTNSDDLSDAFKVSQKPTPDYLPVGPNLRSGYATYSKEILNTTINVTHRITENATLELEWNGNDYKEKELTLPIIIYKNSEVKFNGKILSKNEYKTSDIGSLIIKNPQQKNKVEVSYHSGKLFYFSWYIKILTILGLLIYIIIKKIRKK